MTQGVLYVEIMPSTKGMGKAVEKEATQAFKGAGKQSDGFFSKVGTGLKRVGLGIAGAAAAVAGIAVVGGISRALNIEDAQAKLKGLGHDTKSVEAIMKDALASVKGTAYGLDTAATVAATAVAAGIKPGQELEKYLRLTADAATIAGVSMEEMGSILNKTTTAGKAYTAELNQLADRGIPIFQWLQEEYGVTAEELRKMVAAGKVDSETFRKVIEENIGGAALASGDTTRGAFANMRAALSRLGLVFVEDGVGGAKQFFNEVTIILDGLTERLGPVAGKISEALLGMFEVEGMGDRFLAFIDNLDVGSLINKIIAGRGNLVATGIQIITDLIDGMVSALPEIIVTIQRTLLDVVNTIGSQGPAVINAALMLFLGLAEGMLQVMPQLATAVVHVLSELVNTLLSMLPQLIAAGIVLFVGLVDALTVVIPQLLDALLNAIPMIIEAVVSVIPMIVNALAQALPTIITAALELFLGIVLGLAEAIPEIVTAVLELVPLLIESLIGMIPVLIDGAVQLFLGLVEAIPIIIPALIEAILGSVTTVIETLVASIPLLVDAAVELFTALIMALPIILPDLVMTLIGLMPTITMTIIGLVPQLLAAALKLFMALVEGVWGMFPKLKTALAKVWPEIWSSIKDIPGKMLGFGKDIIQGLVDGARSMIGNAVQAVKDVGGAMLDGIKGFLGIKSPSRVFRDEVGKMVGLGLLEGVGDASIQAKVDRTVSHMVRVPSLAASNPAGSSSVFHLYDEDGTLMAVLRGVMAGMSGAGSARNLNSVFGVNA